MKVEIPDRWVKYAMDRFGIDADGAVLLAMALGSVLSEVKNSCPMTPISVFYEKFLNNASNSEKPEES